MKILLIITLLLIIFGIQKSNALNEYGDPDPLGICVHFVIGGPQEVFGDPLPNGFCPGPNGVPSSLHDNNTSTLLKHSTEECNTIIIYPL